MQNNSEVLLKLRAQIEGKASLENFKRNVSGISTAARITDKELGDLKRNGAVGACLTVRNKNHIHSQQHVVARVSWVG